jgi:hypothetical protein
MNYSDAVALIMVNPFNLQLIPVNIVDIRLLRLAYKKNAWSLEAYCPKKFKSQWLDIILDKIIKIEKPDIDLITGYYSDSEVSNVIL